MFCRICLFALAMLFYGGQTQADCNRCPTGFIHFPTEKKCYKVIPVPIDWDAAFSICNHLGAHLAVVKNAETNAALRSAFRPVKGLCPAPNDASKSAFWTAGRRYPCKNTPPFKWSTGSGNMLDIIYTKWRHGEPNNSGGVEDCIQVIDDGTDSYVWNDINCLSKFCTICEID